eukprot:TRINITY_DN8479_c0_g1_i1.p1 TRINITY_DN8479_c0_g1~~TRINITY_DN8479_c0_g1_i1.p1  ORF type:complete len:281 (-),score=121.52 TRINITY_DN8479_c0_g1_i1:49-891(-)
MLSFILQLLSFSSGFLLGVTICTAIFVFIFIQYFSQSTPSNFIGEPKNSPTACKVEIFSSSDFKSVLTNNLDNKNSSTLQNIDPITFVLNSCIVNAFENVTQQKGLQKILIKNLKSQLSTNLPNIIIPSRLRVYLGSEPPKIKAVKLKDIDYAPKAFSAELDLNYSGCLAVTIEAKIAIKLIIPKAIVLPVFCSITLSNLTATTQISVEGSNWIVKLVRISNLDLLFDSKIGAVKPLVNSQKVSQILKFILKNQITTALQKGLIGFEYKLPKFNNIHFAD